MSRTIYGGSNPTTHYIFDGDGHLLAEHDGATGDVIKEYVWVDDTPLAVVDKSSGTAVTYFIHTGPLDEPLVMTDAAQTKVWDAALEPYGTATVFGMPTSSIDLRLPGQYLEVESGGLHQNWMRSYDPTLGRYVQTDPLGIDAGQNVYAYVDGRPTEWVDPLGLAGEPGIGHNRPPKEFRLPVPPAFLRGGPIAGGVAISLIPSPLNKGEFEQLCRVNAGIPLNWQLRYTNQTKNSGFEFVDPLNGGNRVRFMPGNPGSPYPNSQGPYVRDVRNGNQWMTRDGNRLTGDAARNSPATIYQNLNIGSDHER